MPTVSSAHFTAWLSPALASAYREAIDRWDRSGSSVRLWKKDKALWTGGDEDRWLG